MFSRVRKRILKLTGNQLPKLLSRASTQVRYESAFIVPGKNNKKYGATARQPAKYPMSGARFFMNLSIPIHRIVPILSQLRTKKAPFDRNCLGRWRGGRWFALVDKFSIAATAAAIFSVFARFDPDPHHDGFQLAPAIGVSEGMTMHHELYSHYGPVSAWINGAWLWLTDPTLLNLRLLGSIQLSLTAVLLYSLLVKMGVSRGSSWFVALIWIISCPVWAYESNYFGLWLWPSITFNLIALAVAFAFLRVPPQQASAKKRKIHFCFIGFLLCLAQLTRTKEGLILAIAFLIILAIIHHSVGLFYTIIGFTTTMAMFSLVLFLSGSFQDWLNQTIIGPISNPESVSVGGFDWGYFRSIYLGGNLGHTLALLTILIGLIYAYQKYGDRNLVRFSILASSTVIGHLVLLNQSYSTEILGMPRLMYSAKSSLTYTVAIRFGLLFAIVGSVVTTVVIAFGLFKKTRAPVMRNKEIMVPFALGLGAIANLYPLPDIYHLWWASPSLLLFGVALTKGLLKPRIGNAVLSIAISFVVVVVPLNSLKALKETQQPRTEWSDGSLRGMLIHESIFPSFVAARDVLDNIDRPADFSNCRDPLWAVFTGSYMSKNKYYAALPSYLVSDPISGLIVDCGQGGFDQSANLGVREIASTPEYLNSFSTFASVDKITLYEVQPSQP